MTIDTSNIELWLKSKTTISAIASVLVYIAGVRSWFGLDYTTAVEISTVLAGAAAIFMRAGIAKVENLIKDIPEVPTEAKK